MVQVLLGVLGFLFLMGVLKFLATWPYELGVHIAVQRGVDQYSADAFMLGWFFESIYIAAFMALAVVERSRRRGEPRSSMWNVWGTFVCTIVVVTGLAYIWPSSPT